MNKNKLIETVLLFGSLAFVIMWVNEFIYKGSEIKDSYFFLMFALAGFLFYTYRRGLRIQLEKQEKQNDADEKKKPVIKAATSSKAASSKAASSKAASSKAASSKAASSKKADITKNVSNKKKQGGK